MKLSIALSPCPNDTFVFYALVHKKVRSPFAWKLTLTDIESLNELALHEATDLCKISLALYPQIAHKYWLLNSGGALGYGCGPVLVCRPHFKEQSPEFPRVAVPGEHTTACFLLRLFFPHYRHWLCLPYNQIIAAVQNGTADLGLLIHESRFTYYKAGLELLADLGAMWEAQYNLPVPLGGIAARRSLPEPVLKNVEDDIRQSLYYAYAHPEETMAFVRQHAQELSDDVLNQHIKLFVNHYTFDLGPQGRAAILRLFHLGSTGLAERVFFLTSFTTHPPC
ncbi:MAG: 1,4-dihydroxy-6-naphthoate synthase [Chitinophagales bacterium]|nr:1,4-dihydroxy-6-naphthoate synthase [Chitinophagales bacterium]MDW8427709.1 1,4-dihydroxy-6-naphthoate synthase [Chitinophagales bacterium]